MEIIRIFDILKKYSLDYKDLKIAIAGKQNGSWREYSPQEYVEITNYISYALIKFGIKPDDKIVIIANNRPEWNFLDMAIMQIGAITVPVYPTISANDYLYIFNNCEAKIAFIEGSEVIHKINDILPSVSSLQKIYTFTNKDLFPTLSDFINIGKENINETELEQRKSSVKENDCATIIYTSGTTGTPKGVMLSHSNLVNQLLNIKQTPEKHSNRAFSFLPLCHAYERILVFLYQYLGMSIYYAQNVGTIANDIKEVCPTMMSAVPRVLEKFYDKIYSNGQKLPFIKKAIFYWAVRLARKYKIEDKDRSAYYNFRHRIADKLVYSTIRKGIGGNFDIVVSGAASIQPRLASFFSAIGMPIYEGYGLTETSPILAVSSRLPYGREAGTVGFPLPGIEIKISECGEVQCRGHNVMMGYYKDEELTKQVIDEEGWLHTGDLGKFTEKGQLILTGRKKNIFKTSFGKYINPQLIEEKFSESPFIENLVVVGENQKFAAALISPSFEFLKEWCSRHDIEYTNHADIIKNEVVYKRIAKEIDKYNTFFGDTEKIKRFTLISDEWSQLTEVLTPTLKVKRALVLSRYQNEINLLFGIRE